MLANEWEYFHWNLRGKIGALFNESKYETWKDFGSTNGFDRYVALNYLVDVTRSYPCSNGVWEMYSSLY